MQLFNGTGQTWDDWNWTHLKLVAIHHKEHKCFISLTGFFLSDGFYLVHQMGLHAETLECLMDMLHEPPKCKDFQSTSEDFIQISKTPTILRIFYEKQNTTNNHSLMTEKPSLHKRWLDRICISQGGWVTLHAQFFVTDLFTYKVITSIFKCTAVSTTSRRCSFQLYIRVRISLLLLWTALFKHTYIKTMCRLMSLLDIFNPVCQQQGIFLQCCVKHCSESSCSAVYISSWLHNFRRLVYSKCATKADNCDNETEQILILNQ